MYIKTGNHIKKTFMSLFISCQLALLAILPFNNVSIAKEVYKDKENVVSGNIIANNLTIKNKYFDYLSIPIKDNNLDAFKVLNYSRFHVLEVSKKDEAVEEVVESVLPITPVKEVVTNKKSNVTKKVSTSIEQKILKNNDRIGSAGRLYFSSLYSVALYQTSFFDPSIQKIVDAKDSAAYFKYGSVYLIGDHSNQGFNIIKSQKVGSKAYIKVKNNNGSYSLRTFKVKEVVTGYNYGDRLVTKDGRDVKNIKASLVMYTCNSADGKKVTIVIWEELNVTTKVEKKESPKKETSEVKPQVTPKETEESKEEIEEPKVEQSKEEVIEEPKEEEEEIKDED